MLDVTDLSKKFDSFCALNKVSFSMKPGEIFGYLGPNGAGKTTTINILTTLSRPSSGNVLFNGEDIFLCSDYKKRIGIVEAEPFVHSMMTAYEFLHFVADIREISRNQRKCIDEYLALFEMEKSAHKITGTFSSGMKKKIAVIAALLHKPDILFLDEPTISLDAVSVHSFKQLLQKMKEAGTAIFLTTHILEIAEKLCDRIAIIKNGSIAVSGTVSDVLEKAQHSGLEDLFIEIAKTVDS